MEKQLGILCHVSSVPSDFGIGDFGVSSKNFLDTLADNNINIWQVLPLNITNKYNCPYSSFCYFSYDEMLVGLETFLSSGVITEEDVKELRKLSNTKKVNYFIVKAEKSRILDKIYSKIDDYSKKKLLEFVENNPDIYNFAVVKVLLKKNNCESLKDLDKKYLNKKNKAYTDFVKENNEAILREVYVQYILDGQWKEIRAYAKCRGIRILGDLPIYPNPDSFDVFNNPEAYRVDKKTFAPLVTGGVPADKIDKFDQNWGTCVYDWEYLKSKHYKYLIDKIKKLLERCDILRLDHFLGYVEHYEWSAKNPEKGKWVKGGGEDFFEELSKRIDINRIVVEDIGPEKKEAIKVKEKMHLLGMNVLQRIKWDNPEDENIPKNIKNDSIYYLGTHDNNTYMGYLKKLSRKKKKLLKEYLGINKNNNKQILIESIKRMLNSKSSIIMITMQDVLFQGEKWKMNTPGQAADCWEYRVPKNYKNKMKRFMEFIE